MTRHPWILVVALAGCGLPEYGTREASITGGTPESGYLAVFSLAYQGQPGCTGTCITPKVGLTATHCIAGDPASAFTALFGDTEEDPSDIIQVIARQRGRGRGSGTPLPNPLPAGAGRGARSAGSM